MSEETYYAEVGIRPHYAGFGEYNRDPNAGDPYPGDAEDLLIEIRNSLMEGEELYELGVDELPDAVKDIRGLIHNEPERVFAVFRPEQDPNDFSNPVNYFGIEKVNDRTV